MLLYNIFVEITIYFRKNRKNISKTMVLIDKSRQIYEKNVILILKHNKAQRRMLLYNNLTVCCLIFIDKPFKICYNTLATHLNISTNKGVL